MEEKADDYVEFDMAINIENVECFSLLNHKKELIASGERSICNCSFSAEKRFFLNISVFLHILSKIHVHKF